MTKVPAQVLVTIGLFVLLWAFAPHVLQLGLVLLGAAFAVAVAGLIVLALVDLAGPTRTDAEGNILGFRARNRVRIIAARNLFLARPWRSPAAVRRTAMRAVARVRVSRPAGPAAAEHICVSANPATLDELDEYQVIEEAAWDIGEKYRHATQGMPASGPEVNIWVAADPELPRGYVRVRAALRQPVRTDVVAHATVALTPGDVLPRGAGARPAPIEVNGQSIQPAPAVTFVPAPQGPAESGQVASEPREVGPVTPGPGHGTVPDGIPGAQIADANGQTVVLPRPGTTPTVQLAADAVNGPDATAVFAPPAPAAVGAVSVPSAQLVDATGLALGDAVPLPDGTRLAVGRDPESGIVVPDAHVSRAHLQLRASGGRVWVRDLGSSGGTVVAGRRLAPGEEVAVAAGAMVGLSPQPKTGRPAASLRIG